MFKFNWSLFKSTKPQVTDIPRNFVIKEDNKLLNITMDDDDDLININLNHLTYAEVANMSKEQKLPSVSKSVKPTVRSAKPRATAEEDDELNGTITEKLKSDIHYKKHKEFKVLQKKKRAKRRSHS